jgi:hypothetical protein
MTEERRQRLVRLAIVAMSDSCTLANAISGGALAKRATESRRHAIWWSRCRG